VFAEFSQQIAAHVGKLRDLVVADFSTTTPIERGAFEVLVMDTFEPYFEYEVAAGCGIPRITLLGTPDDWRSVKQRASMLAEFGLEKWIAVLLPILDQLIATSEGRVDTEFWRSFFRHRSISGGGNMSGWLQRLFPYLVKDVRVADPPATPRATPPSYGPESIVVLTAKEAAERRRKTWRKELFANPWLSADTGPSVEAIPTAISSAPVLLTWDGGQQQMRFVSGMFGVSQESDGALRPEFGWAVVYD
jgi:hypothetical protein